MIDQLRVALVVKISKSGSTLERENRNMGYWSYPVPEFTWQHFDYTTAHKIDTSFDLIFIEDLSKGSDLRSKGLPVVYLSIDDTLSADHLRVRQEQARFADLVLVDHGDLSRFNHAKRLNFCVNDHVFKPLEKTTDFTFHCSGGDNTGGDNTPGCKERLKLRRRLGDVSAETGYSYHSGTKPLPKYAAAMGHSKVIVNWPRTPINRPHRLFDAMACGAAVLSGAVPQVSGDMIRPGYEYVSAQTQEEIPDLLRKLLDPESQNWQDVAEAGWLMVMAEHTWAVRAKQLKTMLDNEFGDNGRR